MHRPLLTLALASVLATPLAAQRADTLSLSLGDAIVLASRGGDEARLAEAQVELAEAQVVVARASGLPQLRLSGSYTHVYENARGQAVGQIFNQPNTYGVNANLSQSVFQGGRVFAASRAASHVRAAARLDATDTRATVATSVMRAYLQVLLAARVVEIGEANARLADERLAQAGQLEQAGRAARYDVLRARVERANLEPAIIQARNDVVIAELDLRRLANLPAEQPLRLVTTLEPELVSTVAAELEAAAGNGEGRPSVQAAERTVEARRAGIRIARADLLPTVNLFVQTGYQAFPLTGGIPREGGSTRIQETPCRFVPVNPEQPCTAAIQNGGWFSDRLLGVNVSWPIFDGLRAKGNIDLAQAQTRIAELQLAQERENAALEVARARAELRRARALIESGRQTAVEAEEAFRLASLRFSRGLSTQLEVSDAQLALLTARTNEARALTDLYLATAELARALGRDLPLPTSAAPTSSSTEPRTGSDAPLR